MKLRLALVQTPLVWENPVANRSQFDHLLKQLEQADVVVLPETFTTGFSMQPQDCAEPHLGPTVEWMKSQATRLNAAICGSVITVENERYYNRLYWVTPDGAVDYYDKRHLFTLAGEEKKFSQGMAKKIVDFRGFKLCLQVCYDLRFPVFVRNQEGYDGIIYVANWPKPRMHAWDSLLKARAIENMCYVAAVNRTGTDASNMPYIGHSQSIDPMGEYVVPPFEDTQRVESVEWDKAYIQQQRNRFRFLNDQDAFTVM